MKTLLIISLLYAIIALLIHKKKYNTFDLTINYPKFWTVGIVASLCYVLIYGLTLIITYCP